MRSVDVFANRMFRHTGGLAALGSSCGPVALSASRNGSACAGAVSALSSKAISEALPTE